MARGCGDQLGLGLVVVYNRTAEAVRFDEAWVPGCTRSAFLREDWPRPEPPQMSPPPGSISLEPDLGVPPDYRGDVTVVVTETGVEVVRGPIDESSLPSRCQGVVPH
jgi:hypothetical protein